jgi:hypothetical protein
MNHQAIIDFLKDERVQTHLRSILKIGAGALVAHGLVRQSTVEQWSGPLLGLAGLLWADWSARQARSLRLAKPDPAQPQS